MKKILFACLAGLLCLSLAGQTPEDHHFSVKDGFVTWQLVYDADVDADSALDCLLSSGDFADVVSVAEGFSFTITPRSVDWRSSNVPRSHTPLYILNYQMTGHGLLQIRDGRYRVTVDHIMFLDNPAVALETYALTRQGEFRGVFSADSSNAAAVLDHDFTSLFTMPSQSEEEVW